MNSPRNERENKEKKSFKNILLIALIFSLFFHLLLLPISINLIKLSQKKEKTIKRIKLVLQDKNKKKKQIVTSESKKQKIAPVDTRFLSKDDNRVDRQTKAFKIDSFKTASRGVRHGSKTPSSESKQRQVIEKPTLIPKKKMSLQDLSFAKTESYRKTMAKSSSLGLKSGQRKTAPSMAQNNDYIEEVALGDMTALNTSRFKFYGFYFRIKQKIEQFWGNSLRQRAVALYRSGRRLASNNTRITSLRITLDAKGNVVNIFIKTTSGVQALDDAAVESFNRAGPFPNPPKEMIKNGMATIEWGFVVKS